MEKRYVTTKNLPGGIKEGTGVEFINGQWKFENGNICYYKPFDEPEFFKVKYKTKFNVCDEVYLTEEYAKRYNLSVNTPVHIISAKAVNENKANYQFLLKSKTYSVTEKDIYKSQIYYFISSKGVIQYMPITKKHSAEFAFAYRKAIGNYFKNKEDAQAKLDSIKKEM